jgi:hypothetical protein
MGLPVHGNWRMVAANRGISNSTLFGAIHRGSCSGGKPLSPQHLLLTLFIAGDQGTNTAQVTPNTIIV